MAQGRCMAIVLLLALPLSTQAGMWDALFGAAPTPPPPPPLPAKPPAPPKTPPAPLEASPAPPLPAQQKPPAKAKAPAPTSASSTKPKGPTSAPPPPVKPKAPEPAANQQPPPLPRPTPAPTPVPPPPITTPPPAPSPPPPSPLPPPLHPSTSPSPRPPTPPAGQPGGQQAPPLLELSAVEKHNAPTHARFVWEPPPDGFIELEANRTLRIAVTSQESKHTVSLELGKAYPHEKFVFQDGAIYLAANPMLCLGAEAKTIERGARIVVQGCERSGRGAAPHQGFALGADGRIKAGATELCMNVKGGKMNPGTEIVLWHCKDPESNKNELFVHAGGMIQVRFRPDLHFNVQAGATKSPGAGIVLWKSEATGQDSFEFLESGQLRLKHKQEICLNAERGAEAGHAIIGWPCSKESPTPNELFGYDIVRAVFYARQDPNLVLNVKGGDMVPGASIVLWPAKEPGREEL